MNSRGYGRFAVYRDGSRRRLLAHRVAYQLIVGQIPEGMFLDHVCSIRSCVNPSHLRLATNKQNMEHQPNLRRDNTSGYRGVSWAPQVSKWEASFGHNGRKNVVGYFGTPKEAAEAVRQARLRAYTHNNEDAA